MTLQERKYKADIIAKQSEVVIKSYLFILP